MTHIKGEPYELNPVYYTDTGCVHNPVPKGCLNCPFPKCYHDDPAAFQYSGVIKRDQEIARLEKQGMHYTEIAAHMDLTERTILRSLARSKERNVNADA